MGRERIGVVHSVALPTICVISAWHLLKVLIRTTSAIRACSGASTSKKKKRQGPRAKGQGKEAKRQRGKEAKRQRGIEAERQRGKEAERQRGREAERQRGKEAKRQRGREAERQRGREAERQRFACHFLDNNFHHLNIFHFRRWLSVVCTTQLPVIAVSARTKMKGAKCDKH